MFYVYRITNLVNGKVYIGRTKAAKNRWRQHKRSAECQNPRCAIHRAIKKHGNINFAFEILKECSDYNESLIAEIAAIVAHDSMNPACGYNMTPGGEDMVVMNRLSLAARAKRREIDPEGERQRNLARIAAAHAATVTPQARRRAIETLGPEGLSARAKKAVATMGPAGLSARKQRQLETMTSEQRKASAQKTLRTLGPDGIAARAAKILRANLARTPEQVAESVRKRHETIGVEGFKARAVKIQESTRRNRFNNTVEALLGAT